MKVVCTVCLRVRVYRVFKGVFRGDPLQLFQAASGGIFLLVLAISHQQFVVFAIGYRGQHKYTYWFETRPHDIRLVGVKVVLGKKDYSDIKGKNKRLSKSNKSFESSVNQVTLHLFHTVEGIM